MLGFPIHPFSFLSNNCGIYIYYITMLCGAEKKHFVKSFSNDEHPPLT